MREEHGRARCTCGGAAAAATAAAFSPRESGRQGGVLWGDARQLLPPRMRPEQRGERRVRRMERVAQALEYPIPCGSSAADGRHCSRCAVGARCVRCARRAVGPGRLAGWPLGAHAQQASRALHLHRRFRAWGRTCRPSPARPAVPPRCPRRTGRTPRTRIRQRQPAPLQRWCWRPASGRPRRAAPGSIVTGQLRTGPARPGAGRQPAACLGPPGPSCLWGRACSCWPPGSAGCRPAPGPTACECARAWARRSAAGSSARGLPRGCNAMGCGGARRSRARAAATHHCRASSSSQLEKTARRADALDSVK